MISTSTMTATPAMCQYADTEFSIAVRLTWNMFRSPDASRKAA